MEGVIFDFNGTLLFDDEINMLSWKAYSNKKFNYPLTTEEYYHLNGTPGETWIKYITKGNVSEEDATKFTFEKEATYREEIMKSNLELAKGVIDLFKKLKEAKIPFTIATSSCKDNVDTFFKKFKLNEWFDYNKVVYFDGTFNGKPAPDIYLIAAKKIGVDIKKCIVFEDTKSGVKSGYSSGAKVIGVASSKKVEEVWKFEKVEDVITDYTGITIEKLNKLFEK